jgi:hypothetical protein
VARVFNKKRDLLIDDLMKRGVFGKALCVIHVIEFQKRGLPHLHLLLTLAAADKPRTAEDFDFYVCAEIPCPQTNPELFAIIRGNHGHGACGVHNRYAPCMVDGKCSKRFPKAFQTETALGEDSYPLYKRTSPADGGRTFRAKPNDPNSFVVDNSWIVPYNPALSLKYNCHLNVEICSSISAIKYIYKYVSIARFAIL